MPVTFHSYLLEPSLASSLEKKQQKDSYFTLTENVCIAIRIMYP